MTRHTIRLHFLVRDADAGEVSQALRERVGERIVGLVPQEHSPGLWAASGQWTPEEADALLAACSGLPVRVLRGALLGAIEEGIQVVDRGEEPPGDPSVARYTIRAAIEAWERDTGPGPAEITKEGEPWAR